MKKTTTILLLLLTVWTSVSIFGQEKTDLSFFREKIFLHTDKSYYNAGDDLWFKAYLLKAKDHTLEKLNKAAYVELISAEGDIVATKAIRLSDGTGNGDFKLAISLADGEYTVRGYTSFMRNFGQEDFFTKKIYIKSSPAAAAKTEKKKGAKKKNTVVKTVSRSVGDRPDLQFFPEGGLMLNGHFNRVAFKALDVNGRSMDISGEIVDGAGVKVADFKSEKLGMGQIALKPEAGKLYTAKISYNGRTEIYELPKAVSGGSLLQVMDLGGKYQLNVSTTGSNGIEGYTLVAEQKHGKVFNAELKGNKNNGAVRVPKEELNIGVVRFTLFDGNGRPVCERLAFNDNNGVYAGVEISSGAGSYARNGTVELQIAADSILSTINSKGADLSVSVTELAVAEPKEGRNDIRTYLLLDSELRGNIENPGYYFYSDSPDRKKHLDLLMLTQGWRQFTGEPISEETFYKEKGVTVKGSVRNYFNPKKTDVATVQMTFNDKETMGRVSVKSDDDGNFKFIGLDIMDDNKLSFTANDPKRPMKDFRVKVDPLEPAPVELFVQTEKESVATADGYLGNPSQKSRMDQLFEYDPNRIIELEGVEVADKKKTRRTEIAYKRKSGSIYSQVSGSVDMDDLDGQNFFDFLDIIRGRLPGVSVQGGQIVIRGINSFSSDSITSSVPLFLFNGVEVDQDFLESISVWDIDFIDVLKGSRAAIFGSKGVNGVIAVYTLTGEDEIQKAKEKRGEIFRSYGFYSPRKFYEPGHITGSNEMEKQKYSSTLYWEPELKINGTEKSTLRFPSKTNTGSYKALVQGVTLEGIPVVSEITFEIE